MALTPLTGAGPASLAGAGLTPNGGPSFGKLMPSQPAPTPTKPLETEPLSVAASPSQAKATPPVEPSRCTSVASTQLAGNGPTPTATAAKVFAQVGQAQLRMEQILSLAESGKSFSPAELLSLQAHVYRASQELDLAGKVVEKATGGLKQVLQTQV
jgi:hypothetical protein